MSLLNNKLLQFLVVLRTLQKSFLELLPVADSVSVVSGKRFSKDVIQHVSCKLQRQWSSLKVARITVVG